MDAKKIGKRIRLARVEQDMTQAQLAERIKIKQTIISRYEAGLLLPTLEGFYRLAKALKKTYDYFLDD